jgi:hypothetical protein
MISKDRLIPIILWIGWSVSVTVSGYLFFYGSGFAKPFFFGCVLAVSFYFLRRRSRLVYGLLELLAGGLLLGNAIYSGSGRGAFSPPFSAEFARFDPRAIALQSYGGLFIIIRGLDNIGEGWTRCPACARLAAALRHRLP